MKNILRSLSPTSLNDSMEKDNLNERGWGFLSSAFHNFLKGKRILIILDNVLDPNFLHEMWQAAAQDCPQVTYLVTSQLPNLCNSFRNDSSSIAMGDTTKDEAMRILASLVGLDPDIIHDTLKDVAMEMIEATESNLLALACLATHFDGIPDKTDEKAWLEALDDLRIILNCHERKFVLGLGLDKSPHRSLWSAMELCLKSLETRDAKVIFFLIYACQGHSVPQEILAIWYECINTSSCTFSRSREELRSRELVKLCRGGLYTYLEGNGRDLKVPAYGVWSLRPLVKLYVEHLAHGKKEVMKEEFLKSKIGCAMDSFLNDEKFPVGSSVWQNSSSRLVDVDNEKAKVAIVLCALYFNHYHAERLVLDLATKAQSACNVQDCSLLDGRRQAMEPIIWLLSQPKHGKWTELDLHCARKVFLTYTCERQLDGDGFSTLLKVDAYPPAQLATLRALLYIFTVEETPLPWQHARRTLNALLALLDSSGRCSTSAQEAASKAVVPMLDILFSFLSPNNKADLRLQAALALLVLTDGDEASIGKKLVRENGEVAGLVKSWSQNGKRDWQEQVMRTLEDVARPEGDSVRLAILNEEGVLAAIVKVLVEHNDGILRELAAMALRDLATSPHQSFTSRIANEKGAIVGLVKCLSVGDKPALQSHAAGALTNLVLGNIPNQVAVANEPGAVAALVKLVSEHDRSTLPGEAAGTIWSLVAGEGDWDWVRMKILNEGGIIALAKALHVQENPHLQEKAAGALASLAFGDNCVVGQTIANESKAITGLVKLLSNKDVKQNRPGLRKEAARAFRNLAVYRDHRILLKMGCEDGALTSLVECLSEPDFQENATIVISELTKTRDDSLMLKMRNENGLLTALGTLSQHVNPSVQINAKYALKAFGEIGGAT